MSNALKLRRGTAAQHATFVGAPGEVTVDTDSQTLRLHDGVTAGGRVVQPALTQQLLQWAYSQTFQLVSATRDANGAITTATIKWPDGASGVFTTDAASAVFPGAIDAWHATYAGATTKTVTQPAVTRDANGAVTVQPALTIS